MKIGPESISKSHARILDYICEFSKKLARRRLETSWSEWDHKKEIRKLKKEFMQKRIEQLEIAVAELEKTVLEQQKLIVQMNNNLMAIHDFNKVVKDKLTEKDCILEHGNC